MCALLRRIVRQRGAAPDEAQSHHDKGLTWSPITEGRVRALCGRYGRSDGGHWVVVWSGRIARAMRSGPVDREWSARSARGPPGTGRAVRVGDRQRDRGLTLPVAVFLPAGGLWSATNIHRRTGTWSGFTCGAPSGRTVARCAYSGRSSRSASDSGITGADTDAIFLYPRPGPASVLHHHRRYSGSGHLSATSGRVSCKACLTA